MIYQVNSAGRYLGEDRRNRGLSYNPGILLRQLFNSAVIVQDIKVLDTSFYDETPNFDTMRTVAIAVIVRAMQGTAIDPQFARSWAEAKRTGLRRGTYAFYDDRVDPLVQAAILINLLVSDRPEMEIWIDWEKTYGGPYAGLKNVVKMMKAVEAGLPGATVGMYTGYYWFRENSNSVTHTLEYTYLKSHPLWLAWYTNNPSYVLIPAPWTKLTWWQFTDSADGTPYGCTTFVDINYFNGTKAEFDVRYGGVVPPPPPPPSGDELKSVRTLCDGLVHETWVAHFDRGDITYYLTWVDLSKVKRFFVTPYQSHKDYVTTLVKENNMHFGINGTGWSQDLQTQIITVGGPAVSNGTPYPADRVGGEATLYIHPNKTFSLSKPAFPWAGGNAISFPNKLITGGQKIPINKSTSDIDPRMAYFYTEGYFVFMGVDGIETYDQYRTGMSFFEVQDRMFMWHAKEGFMNDGGGSGTMVSNISGITKIVNVPCGEELVDGYRLRRVPQALCVEMLSDAVPPPPPPGGNMKHWKVIIAHRPRSQPTLNTLDQDPLVPIGTEFDSNIEKQDTATPAMMVQVLAGPWAGKWLIGGFYSSKEYTRDITVVPPVNTWPPYYVLEDPDGNRMGYRKDETIST
jgi:GH25 family lysozyme M1 (1,4-beta-N-acetylmuramidase)